MKFTSKTLLGLFIFTVLIASMPFNAWAQQGDTGYRGGQEDTGYRGVGDVKVAKPDPAIMRVIEALSIVAPVLNHVLTPINKFEKKLFDWLLMGLAPMLETGNFIEAPAVQKLWPVVLGVANLGFLLALIIIALLVTLRLDIGGGVRKLLPRLLLGAVLINFSLIIGGLIIDISRLLTAMVASLFGISSLRKDLFIKAYDGSGMLEIQAQIMELNPVEGWDETIGLLVVAILSFIMIIAIAVVLFTLVIRYFALIILLILSPFAYVTLAFPGTQKIAIAWWSHFLKYALYGPIVLLLILIALGTSASLSTEEAFVYAKPNGKMAYLVLKITIFVTGLILAATAGRYAGIVGSQAALNVASGVSKKARSLAYRGARGTAKGAYVYSGVQRAGREARAIGSKATEPIRKTMGWGEHSKFDAKTGKLKTGKKTAFGIGERLQHGVGYITPGAGGTTQRKAGVAAKEMRDNITDPSSISHTSLRNEEAAKRLSDDEVENMTINMVDDGDSAKTVNMVSNVEIVRKMNAAAQAAVFDSDDMEAIKALNASLRRLADKI